MQYALKRKFTTSENREHWMDHAEGKYEKSLIEDVKLVLRYVRFP